MQIRLEVTYDTETKRLAVNGKDTGIRTQYQAECRIRDEFDRLCNKADVDTAIHDAIRRMTGGRLGTAPGRMPASRAV